MTCYDIVVDSKWTVDLIMTSNCRIACYDIVKDSEWTVYLFGDL